jgi:hypothetical protein
MRAGASRIAAATSLFASITACAPGPLFEVRGELKGRPPLFLVECGTPNIYHFVAEARDDATIFGEFLQQAYAISDGYSSPVVVRVRGYVKPIDLRLALEHPLTPRYHLRIQQVESMARGECPPDAKPW